MTEPAKYRKSILPYRSNQIASWLEWLAENDIYLYTHNEDGTFRDIDTAAEVRNLARSHYATTPLQALRVSTGLTAAQAAKVMDINTKTWNNWEQGRRDAPKRVLARFKAAVHKLLNQPKG